MAQAKITFGYWSDPLCIWAYVAQEKLDHVLARHGGSLRVDYHVVPVFGSVPWRFREGPWSKEGIEGRVEATRRIAHQHGCPEVSGEAWRVAQPSSSWSPGAAIKACFACEGEGLAAPGTSARYLTAIRRRFFVDDVNVALRSEQLRLAEELEISREAIERRLDDGSAQAMLWEDYQEKERLKIQGSPTYVFDGGRAQLYGDFPTQILEATIEALLQGKGPGASAC